jgi:hypothetical protein
MFVGTGGALRFVLVVGRVVGTVDVVVLALLARALGCDDGALVAEVGVVVVGST